MVKNLSDLKPNERNPRTISDAKLGMLKKAIAEFGDLSGIVFNRRTGQLVGGHQRVKVLPEDALVSKTEFKKPTRTGTVAEGYVSVDGERIRYREVDWDETKEKAANIAANRGAGEWDEKLLAEMMREIDEFGFDLDLTMFEEGERDGFLAEDLEAHEKAESENRWPEKPPERVARGDIFILGKHRLICGDSTDLSDIKRLMRGEKAGLVFTSPPYNGNTNLSYGKKGRNGPLYLDNETDNKTSAEYLDFNRRIFCSIQYATEEDANVFYNISYNKKSRDEWVRIVLNAIDAGFNLYETIVWKKIGMPNSAADVMTRNWEFIFLFNRDPISYRTNKEQGEGYASNFWDIPNAGAQSEAHAACFPVALPEKAILDTSSPGELIFEPFGGSGTTIIAAEKTGRRCYAVELDPRYCDAILARWEEYTGEKAKRVKPK